MLLQVRRDAHVTELLIKDTHNHDSHAEDRARNINNQQRIGIARSVRVRDYRQILFFQSREGHPFLGQPPARSGEICADRA